MISSLTEQWIPIEGTKDIMKITQWQVIFQNVWFPVSPTVPWTEVGKKEVFKNVCWMNE